MLSDRDTSANLLERSTTPCTSTPSMYRKIHTTRKISMFDGCVSLPRPLYSKQEFLRYFQQDSVHVRKQKFKEIVHSLSKDTAVQAACSSSRKIQNTSLFRRSILRASRRSRPVVEALAGIGCQEERANGSLGDHSKHEMPLDSYASRRVQAGSRTETA